MLSHQRQKVAAQLQAQVAEVLKQSNLEDLPACSGVCSLPAPFLAFLQNHLDAAHLVPEEVEQFAAELDSLAPCTKLQRPADDDSQDDDLQIDPDQVKEHLPCHDEWLSCKTAEEQDALITEVEAQIAMLDAQLRDTQELDLHMDNALRMDREERQQLESVLAHASTSVAAEVSSSLQLNSDINQWLEALQHVIKDMLQLVQLDGRKFLLLAADASPYAMKDTAFVDLLQRYLGSISSSSGPALEDPSATADPVAFLEDNNPWQPASSRLSGGGSVSQDNMHAELKRLRVAYFLSETQYVAAAAELQGVKSEMEELQRIRREYKATLATGGPQPWVSEEARQAIATRAADLRQEVHALMSRIRNTEASQLAQLQDVHVLQGDYAAKEARNAAAIAHRQAMVNALFLVKAAHLVLYQLLDAELKRLEHMVGLVQDVGCDVADLVTAVQGRITQYEALRAAPTHVAAPLSPQQQHGKQHNGARGQMGGAPSPARSSAIPGSPHGFNSMFQKYAHRQNVGKDPYLGAIQDIVQVGQQHLSTAGASAAAPTLPLPTSTRQLAESIESLAKQLAQGEEDVQAMQGSGLPGRIQAARQLAREARGLVFEQPSSTEPTLREPGLEAALGQLEQITTQLQTVINEHVNAFTAFTRAKEAHRADSMRERNVLALFYTNPDKLDTQLEDLQEQLNGLVMTGG